MKKLLAAIAVIGCMVSLSLNAGQGKHPEARQRKEAIKAELLGKYDANKDGKISKAERAQMSKHDKKLAGRAGLREKHARKNKQNKQA